MFLLWIHKTKNRKLRVEMQHKQTINYFQRLVQLNRQKDLPGFAPSEMLPFQIWCRNSGRLSFISITLMTMSMGFSTWFPFTSTACALSCENNFIWQFSVEVWERRLGFAHSSVPVIHCYSLSQITYLEISVNLLSIQAEYLQHWIIDALSNSTLLCRDSASLSSCDVWYGYSYF